MRNVCMHISSVYSMFPHFQQYFVLSVHKNKCYRSRKIAWNRKNMFKLHTLISEDLS